MIERLRELHEQAEAARLAIAAKSNRLNVTNPEDIRIFTYNEIEPMMRTTVKFEKLLAALDSADRVMAIGRHDSQEEFERAWAKLRNDLAALEADGE